MSNAEYLLSRALESYDNGTANCDLVFEEIRAYLATPRTERELIYVGSNAHMEFLAEEAECANMVLDDKGVPKDDGNGNVYSLVGRIERYRKLSAEQRKPLSVKEIEEKWFRDKTLNFSWLAFLLGFRFAETHHEIGDSNGN